MSRASHKKAKIRAYKKAKKAQSKLESKTRRKAKLGKRKSIKCSN